MSGARPSHPAAHDDVAAQAVVFAALGDPTRLGLVITLAHSGPLSVARLTSGTRVTRQAVSKHLLLLARAGLVQGRRRGRESLWELEPGRLDVAQRFLDLVSRRWDEALARLRAAVEE